MKIWLIIFLVLLKASHRVQSQTRLVVNTTCLELAKPSNQQDRLTCRQYDYHCLQDDTFTKEFEVCREWKWIPGGKCAYFNTYGSGNVDERGCTPGINLACSQSQNQFESNKNTQFSACYAKRDSSTYLPTSTSPVQVTSDMVSNGDTGRSSQTSKAWIVLLVVIVIAVICLCIFAVLFILGKKPFCEKVSLSMLEKGGSSANTEEGLLLKQSESLSENKSLKQEEVEDSDNDEPQNFEDALTHQPNSGRQDDPRENSAEIIATGSCSATAKAYHEAQDIEESTDIFDGTLESLQKEFPTSDTQDGELCKKLYNLLQDGGWNLSQKVMATVITRKFGKSVKEFVADETIKNKVMEELKKTDHQHILKDSEQSITVSYNLLRNNLGEEHYPKSGWGNPVLEKDIGIGDDVERLYKVHAVIKNIENQMTVSVESYIRLLDIMIEALLRLDPGTEFKEDYKLLSYELKSIKNPNLTQRVLKTITDIVKKIW